MVIGYHSFWFMMLTFIFSRAPRHCASFSTAANQISMHRIAPYTTAQTRLFASKTSPSVEISPANHGTRPLPSLFSKSNIHPRLVKALTVQNITTPTPIQAHGIPLLQKGYDVMGSAQTGTGKTVMFSLPLCERILERANNNNKNKGPDAIILNPTRELAMQTADALQKLTKNTPLRVSLATGGESVAKQQRQLDSCDILVGTPGRVLQFVDERMLSLKSIQDVVVDEADRMMDMGFEPQLKRIARALGRKSSRDERRTVLCSATFPPDVQRVAADFMKQNYFFVAAGRVGATHEGIVQTLKWIDSPAERRKTALNEVKSFLKNNNSSNQRVIVFCNTKDEAERMGVSLKGTSARVVTGDKAQSERNKSLEAFRKGKVQVLVATDVAARGLDVNEVGLIVQVDAPRDVDTFVHRVGRTGRAGAKGSAVALLDGRSVGIAPALVEVMNEAKQEIPAWLMGMSYVARARQLEEEGAIAAGGGGTLDVESMPESASDESSNETFSAQDFRSSADAGSWGSERDTSYHSFDEEAYSSLDSVDGSMNATREALDEGEEAVVAAAGESSSPNVLRDEKSPGVNERKMATPVMFESPKPSKELRVAIQRISGTSKVGRNPNRKVLTALSKRGESQRLRFEYLGMFPFDSVSNLLMSRGNRRLDQSRSDHTKVLMVAEKPSIAKAVADALSGPRGARQKRGISRALPVYEFTSDAFVPSNAANEEDMDRKPARCVITVTSVVGHIFSIGFVQEEGERGPMDPSEYFRLPIVKQEEGSTGKLRVVDHLRALAADADHLVLWLDCDAEGENIAHEVIGVTRRALEQKSSQEAKNSSERLPTRRVHRARFSAITGDALRDSFSNLVEPDSQLSRSVDARQELDLRVGVALTRLLTWRCVGLARQRYSAATKFISYGPCQTPALSFCVDRAREIEAFVPEDYWKVHIAADSPRESKGKLNLRWIPPEGSEVRSKANRRRGDRYSDTTKMTEDGATFDPTAAQHVVKLASSANASAKITHIDHLSESINAPLGLNTVGLLAAGSKAMGMSPKKVMQVAEKLYSAGLISYPRTETTRYDPKGFDVRSMLRQHTSHPEWGRTASYLLRTKYSKSGRPPLRGHDAGDHPPITCLRAATREEVGGGAAWRVYEFVARNFLGSLGDELKYTRVVAKLQLDSDRKQKFEVEKVRVDSLGFAGACRWVLRDIGAEQNINGGDKGSTAFREGMTLPIVDARSELCATKPPRFLQEHELIELMDKKRIGTDASMATHVNNIVERGYVALCDETGTLLRPPRPPRPGQRQPPRQVGRYLVPTPLGISLIDLFDKTGMSNDAQASYQDESPALLSRPEIRAQMEEEVKQIATGELDKAECVEQNLAWFEARYNELVESLSRQRLNEFARALRPTKDALRYWQRLGAFETPQPTQQKPKPRRGGSNTANRKSKGGKRKPAKSRGPRSSTKQRVRR